MSTTARTTCGMVRGEASSQRERAIVSFRGIPFAAPPIGADRFAPPLPPEPWSGERAATRFGAAPPQTGGALLDLLRTAPEGELSEDCLSVNVFTPGVDGARRPVMVWIHGGAFISGTSGVAMYDGARLAARGDVVVVSFNYRVGALGFLHLDGQLGADGPRCTNRGLLDQIAALRFVRDNIEGFGGDPDRVTVFGESAGAGSIGALLAAPSAAGLLHGAIVQSGAPDGYLSPDEANERSTRFLEVLGEKPEALAGVSVEALLAAQQQCAAERVWKTGMFFTPVIDGEILPTRPMAAVRDGSAPRIPLIIGTTRDELQLYKYGSASPELPDAVVQGVMAEHLPDRAEEVLQAYRTARKARGESLAGIDLIYAFQTDLAMRAPAIRMAEHHAARQPDTFMYLFDWESPVQNGELGACHALDVPFTFGSLDQPGVASLTGAGESPRRVSDQLMDAWIAFARTGRPDCESLGSWPRYDARERSTMRIGAEPGVVAAPRESERVALADLIAGTTP